MSTPTPEEQVGPEPLPSVSTPILVASPVDLKNERRRRHTITRPDSAAAMLSDEEHDGDDGDRTFHRISGILTNLIQEANEAVSHSVADKARVSRKTSKATLATAKTTTIPTTTCPPHPAHLRASRIPRPRQDPLLLASPSSPLSSSPLPALLGHGRGDSISSFHSSSSSLTSEVQEPFSPAMSETTDTSVSRSPSPAAVYKQSGPRRSTYSGRPLSCPTMQLPTRKSMTPSSTVSKRASLMDHTSLLESFKRLDSSLALVDSLSRDLATPADAMTVSSDNAPAQMDRHFTMLFLLPLLHIPHALIATVIDSLCEPSSLRDGPFPPVTASTESSFSLSNMVALACVFALANLVVDKVALFSGVASVTLNSSPKTRRLSLPGAYNALAGRADTPAILPPTTPMTETTNETDQPCTTRHRRRRPNRRSTLYRKRQAILNSRQQQEQQQPTGSNVIFVIAQPAHSAQPAKATPQRRYSF